MQLITRYHNVLMVRYVYKVKENGLGKTIERFIQFVDFRKKTGIEISEMIELALKNSDISL